MGLLNQTAGDSASTFRYWGKADPDCGELAVIDPSAFAIALRVGIGHAKASGCGLMLVRCIG